MSRSRRILALLPTSTADASDAVKLGLRLRNEASVTGRCECGAIAGDVVELEPGVFNISFEHTPTCPAASPELERAIRNGEIG